MALARLLTGAASRANSNATSSLTSNYYQTRHGAGLINMLLGSSNATVANFSSSESAAVNSQGSGQEVAVRSGDNTTSDGDGEGRRSKWKSLLPRRFQRGRRNNLWRNESRDMAPSPFFDEFSHPSNTLSNALMEATHNINRLFDTLSPSHLFGRMKERDDSYKLRFEVPGLSKEDIKITVDDGILNIRGEHKEEQRQSDEEESDGDDDRFGFYSSRRSYYNSSMVLPEDVKEDGIKAELKNGVLTVIVPKDEKKAKKVKEIEID